MTNIVEVEAERAAQLNEQPREVDIQKVAALIKHMHLTIDSFCELAGVSRVAYYNWLKGRPMRRTKAVKIRELVRKLVVCVTHHGWPNAHVFQADQKTRLVMLKELLETLDKTEAFR